MAGKVTNKSRVKNNTLEDEDIEDFAPRTRSTRAVLTPGDYTKRIGNRKNNSSQMTTSKSTRPRGATANGIPIEKTGPARANRTNPYHKMQSGVEKDYLNRKIEDRRNEGRPGGSYGNSTKKSTPNTQNGNRADYSKASKRIIGQAFDRANEATERKAKEKKPSWYTNNGSKVKSTSVKKVGGGK